MVGKPSKGPAGIAAASTALSDIDGAGGPAALPGCDIGQPAGSVTFEEIAILLIRPIANTFGERGLTWPPLAKR